MTLVFTQNAVERAGPAARRQWNEVAQLRNISRRQERHLATLTGNAAADLTPRFWLDLDQATTELMGQTLDPLFTMLMGLSRSVHIGKLVHAYRKLGAIDQGETSLTGQITHLMGNVGASYDGVVIPVHTKAFGRQWREVEGQRSMGYDDLADDQAASVREVQRLMAENFMSGKAGLNYQGYNSTGLRNNPNVKAVGLTVDFTDPAATFADMQTQFVSFLANLRGRNNRLTEASRVFISPEIEQNWQRISGPQTIDRTYWRVLAETAGVASIETSYLLTGNEVLAVVPNRAYIYPVTGMAVTTTPVPRLRPFDDWQFITWSASALVVKSDAEGRTGVIFGTDA